MRKKFKKLIFSKMAPTILIKFCGFIVQSKHNNMTLSAFPEKSLKLEKYILIFFRLLTQGLNELINLVQNRYLGSCRKYLEPFFFSFHPNPKIKGSSHKKKNKKIDFLKNGSMILIKFCGLIVYYKPNKVTLANFPGKNP